MNKKNPERGLSKEYLRQVIRSTPEMRLKWLEDACEFVKQTVAPQKIALWQKIKREN